MSKLTLTFKGKVLKSYPIVNGELIIGSAPECDIHIDSLALQDKHARITTTRHTSVLEDLGSEGGTLVNNKPIKEPYTLEHDDEIQVGKHLLLYTTDLPDLAEEDDDSSSETLSVRPSQKNAWMQILNGANVGKTISLNRTLTNLGKPGVQLAVIARRGEGYYLSHLEGERSPTVDGVSIGDQSYPLQDGNVIQIGNIKMQFSLV